MSLKHIMKSSASTALAILLAGATLAAPAQAAADRDGGGNRGGAHAQSGGSWRGGGAVMQRSQAQRPQAQRSQAMPRGGGAPRAEGRGDWSRNNGAAPNTMRRGGWGDVSRTERGGGNRPPVVQNRGGRDGGSETPNTWRRDTDRGTSGRIERNRDNGRTYADRDRNRTYSRDDRQRQSETWRDRDGDRRWSGNADRYRDRDNNRWRDNDRNRWRDNDRRGDHRRWDNNWRRDNRYDWYSYRNQYRHVYRPGRYYAPYRHHHYSRLSIGFFLGSGFYGSRYWISDPWHYRLPEPYGPYRWVRYYDDVLLVDMYSGEVVDVIYDFFW